MNEISHMKYKHGWSIPAAGGSPPMMYNERSLFTKPHVPFYSIEQSERQETEHNTFTYRGLEVEDFSVCLWGDTTLQKASNCCIAFGIGTLDGTRYAFYKKKKGLIKRGAITSERNIASVMISGDEVCYITKPDPSPISHRAFCDDASSISMFGDGVAIANYGNYPHSNAHSAMSRMEKVYNEHNSSIPDFVKSYLRPYPWFTEGAVEFSLGQSTMLKGHKSIKFLKFINNIVSAPITIDLNSDVPFVALVAVQFDEFDLF
jgi:hypothetical protein